MTQLSQLFDLPKETTASSFVVNLTAAADDVAPLLDQYVVTEQLASSFGLALEQIKQSVDSNKSVASYLHGSFGSGKSHFMAVLYALLQRHEDALSKRGLESVVQKYNPWLQDKTFLLVPYHMIGGVSLEQKLLGGYAECVAERHPDKPKPMVYKGDELFEDAAKMRATLGDAVFFQKLNEGATDGGDWGEGDDDWGADESWNAATYEAASTAPPDDPDRLRLLNALIDTYFQSYSSVVDNAKEAYVDLDLGLSIITEHARKLGYDALVLFIDEIILWLASHVTETGFLEREGQKLAKLVEGQHDKAIPVISFMARQKSLKEFAGNQLLGSDQARVEHLIEHWEGRFGRINLEDRNLPEIVAQRLLRPLNADAKILVDKDFEKTLRVQQEIKDHLQTNEFDREHFRKLYPFSPALVNALVAVSSLLQRERTALKVMAQLLFDRRDMELGGVIPVGDVWDEIASGNAPFAGDASALFEQTKRLYEQKLLPMIEAEAGITKIEFQAGQGDPGVRTRFEANDRLIKTLLLAALAPNAPSLEDLTAQKLVALNHGSIRHPIPGQEATEALNRCKAWATQGPLRVGTGDIPTIHVVVDGVDLDPLLDKVAPVDTQGARLQMLRGLLYEQLGIASRGEVFDRIDFEHKGVKREFEVLFQNVHGLSDDSLSTTGDGRRLIIDYPFDSPDQSAEADRQRIERFQQSNQTARTVVWLPSFLSESSLRDLGRLVRIDYLLTGDRLNQEAEHLTAQDRNMAKQMLQNQGTQLRDRLNTILMGAYGAGNPVQGTLSETDRIEDHWISLDPGMPIRPPVGGSLGSALKSLMTQVLDAQFPDHPNFDTPITPTVMRKVWEVLRQALEDPDARTLVEKSQRSLMRQVAVPVNLGQMGETHFVLRREWYDQLIRKGAQAAIGDLREALDAPRPRGLPVPVENVVLMVYAAQADSTFTLQGGPYEPSIDRRIPSEVTLAKVDLPTEEEWTRARTLVGSMFGVNVSKLRNATNVGDLVGKVEAASHGRADDCRKLVAALDQTLTRLGVEPEEAPRRKTAQAVAEMLEQLQGQRDADFVRTLLQVRIETSEAAMGSSLKSAANVVREIEGANWKIVASLLSYDGPKKADAIRVIGAVRELIQADEYAQLLMPELRKLEDEATEIVVGGKTPPPPPPLDGMEVVASDERDVQASAAAEVVKSLQDALAQYGTTGDTRLKIDWKIFAPKKRES